MKKITYLLVASALFLLTSCDFSSKSKGKSNNSSSKTQNQTEQTDTSVDGNNNSTDNSSNKNDNKAVEEKDDNSFKSAKGYFSINFPAPPAMDTTYKETSNAGTLYGRNYFYSKSKSAMYIVTYVDYNEGMINDKNREDMLQTRANAFITKLGGKIANSSKGKVDDYPSLTWNSKVKDSLNINMKGVFVGRRYYQFGTMAYSSEISDKESKAFIESFKVKK